MLKLSQDEMREFYNKGRIMIMQYKTVYQIMYSINAGYYLSKIRTMHTKGVGLTLRGRFIATDTEWCNKVIECSLSL